MAQNGVFSIAPRRNRVNVERVDVYLAQGCWFRTASNIGAVSLDAYRYALGPDWGRAEVDITFDPTDPCLVFKTPTREREKRLPIKGLTAADLMGELGPLAHMNHFQLYLSRGMSGG